MMRLSQNKTRPSLFILIVFFSMSQGLFALETTKTYTIAKDIIQMLTRDFSIGNDYQDALQGSKDDQVKIEEKCMTDFPNLEKKKLSTNRFIEEIKNATEILVKENHLSKKCDHFYDNLDITLTPEQIRLYVELQHSIADKEEAEEKRPTIHLHLRGKKINQKDPLNIARFGILGGVGPISDSHLIKKVLKALHKLNPNEAFDYISIDLLSAPIPRPPLYWKLPKLIYYAKKRVLGFTHNNYDKMWVASNTAHTNFHILKNPWFFYNTQRWDNLTEKVAEEIKKDISKKRLGKNGKVLVLGTLSAFKKNLYPKLLKKNGVDAIMPNYTNQKNFQQLINDIKSGSFPKSLLFSRFISFVNSGLNNDPDISHILLSCTELAIIVNKKNVKRFIKKQSKKRKYPLTIMDSEDIFVKSIANEINRSAAKLKEK